MALIQDDTPPPAFTWGANGARLTPEQIVNQRKVADALALQGSDASAFPTGTRGAGLWTQGLNRLAKGVAAGFDYREADQAAKANADDNRQLITALLSGGAPPAATTSPVAAAPATTSAPATSTVGKIYNNDEPSPLDPPSGADRDAAIRTVYGEAGNEPTKGQLAVASVIRNRAIDGGYGGDTPTAVVHAPNQFEPWNGGVARDRMLALSPDDPRYQAIGKVVDAAYGTGGRAPDDPTEGKTMFYSPAAQAALGRPAPAWAKGEGQVIGGHTFYDDPEDTAPVQVASNGPVAVPRGAAPSTSAYAPATATPASPAAAAVTAAATPAAPAAPPATPGTSRVSAALAAVTSPYADATTKQMAAQILAQETKPKAAPAYRDNEGNLIQIGPDGLLHVPIKATEDPTSVREYEYYKKNFQPTPQQPTPIPYDVWSTAKARAAATNVTTNVDTNSSQTYDKQLAEGLGKSHAALANGVEDAQTRARDIAALQGAVDSIQKNGGTTGGFAPEKRLELQKTINAGAAALGIEKPFDEADLSDKEFLTKFNRSLAGAQAKNAVGSRVTNFELSNFLKANPGIGLTITGNQRLLGIQAQIEQRNIAVGNAIREATAQAISQGKKIDPVTVQHIITEYDAAHHVQDPLTGQDLTQSVALPEFQQGNNAALAADHKANINKIRRFNPITGAIE